LWLRKWRLYAGRGISLSLKFVQVIETILVTPDQIDNAELRAAMFRYTLEVTNRCFEKTFLFLDIDWIMTTWAIFPCLWCNGQATTITV
jgi:hypothetical protein